MKEHCENISSVLKALDSDEKKGLSEAQVKEKREKFGENRLQEKKKKSNFQRFIDQFKDAMILILIAAAIISFAIACMEGNVREFFEPALILLIVILNAVMGVMQESKAEKAIEALKSLSAPHARVIRDGKLG
ncbi:MAG: cation-transporting P-type ATPase, partial [Ruminococcus sp.]